MCLILFLGVVLILNHINAGKRILLFEFVSLLLRIIE